MRVGIAGAGFIGAVHARSARLAGATLAGVADSSPENAEAAARRLGAERAFESALALAESPDMDVVHVCTPNHLHLPVAEAALAAGKHVICEKPLALDAAGAERLTRAGGRARTAARPCRSSTATTRRSARRGSGSGAAAPAPSASMHGTYLQDWLLKAEDDNWRVDAELGGASRAFADIGSHWCDLAEFVTGHRIARLSARTLTAIPERVRAAHREAFAAGGGDGEARAVGTEDAAVDAVRDRRRRGRDDGDQPDLRRPQEPAVAGGRRCRGVARLRPGGAGDAVVRPPRGRERSSSATPPFLSEPAARLNVAARGPPAGLGRLLRRVRRRRVRRDPRRASPPTGCRSSPTACATARITDAVLESARARTTGSTFRPCEPMEVAP